MNDALQSKPKIILIDDDPSLGRAIGKMLSKKYELCVLANGVDLKPTLDEFSPDLLILDMSLPWIGGDDLCRLIRSYDAHKYTPIIVYSGHQDFIDVMGVMEAGANAYLTKPLGIADLEKNIERLLMTNDLVNS